MTLRTDLTDFVASTFSTSWARRNGRVVPDTDSLTFKNEAVDIEATILYADLADSTGLVAGWKDFFAADVYKNYLYCASRLIRDNGGEITAYDGDRVMGVFVGAGMEAAAVKTGLKINWAVNEIIKPAIDKRWTDNTFKLKQKVGIDKSPLMVAKTGVRTANDLVWVGTAANNAAKLAARDSFSSTYITSRVYDPLVDVGKYGGSPKENMWSDLGWDQTINQRVYGSTWQMGI